jgi:phage host-nuclease inhibitor protein Gam
MSALPEDLLPPDLALDEPPLTDDEVEGFIEAAAVKEDDDPNLPRWRIEDDGAAEWAMRKLARELQARGPIVDQAEAWTSRIEEWLKATLAPFDRRIRWWEGHLTDYARRQREAGRKTVSLPSGKVSTRPVPASVKVADEAQVLAGLPAEVRELVVKESVRLRELQQATAVARTATLHLACNHSFECVVLDPKEIGPVTNCSTCDEGEGENRSEVSITSVELSAPIPVLKTTRKPVPGAIVEPERVSVSVKPS